MVPPIGSTPPGLFYSRVCKHRRLTPSRRRRRGAAAPPQQWDPWPNSKAFSPDKTVPPSIQGRHALTPCLVHKPGGVEVGPKLFPVSPTDGRGRSGPLALRKASPPPCRFPTLSGRDTGLFFFGIQKPFLFLPEKKKWVLERHRDADGNRGGKRGGPKAGIPALGRGAAAERTRVPRRGTRGMRSLRRRGPVFTKTVPIRWRATGPHPCEVLFFREFFHKNRGLCGKKQRNEGARPCPTGKRWGRALLC